MSLVAVKLGWAGRNRVLTSHCSSLVAGEEIKYVVSVRDHRNRVLAGWLRMGAFPCFWLFGRK